jgi:hypothetical protein
MTDEAWTLLEGSFEKFPFLKAGSISNEEIDRVFKDFDFPIPNGYREFVHQFGGAVVGQFSIFGIGAPNMMGNDCSSAIEVTNRFRKEGWPGVKGWLVISTDHSGNPVGLDVEEKIWISDHDHGCIDKLSENFERYIVDWCFDNDGEIRVSRGRAWTGKEVAYFGFLIFAIGIALSGYHLLKR